MHGEENVEDDWRNERETKLRKTLWITSRQLQQKCTRKVFITAVYSLPYLLQGFCILLFGTTSEYPWGCKLLEANQTLS